MSQMGSKPEDTIPALKIRTEVCLNRAAKVGLSFVSNKSELVHCLPESSRNKTKHFGTLPTLMIESRAKSFNVQPTRAIKQLGVMIDESPNFLTHTKHAASKGMQSLGRLRFLRQGNQGIPAYIAMHLTMTAIPPKMLWASLVWWLRTPGNLGLLALTYNRCARWITGLPLSTNITKLLICAHLRLYIYLDYLSRRYAIRTLFLLKTHVLHHRIPINPEEDKMLGIRRIESFVDGTAIYRLEDRQERVEGSIKMNKFLVHIGKTDDSDQIHNQWLASLLNGTVIIYSDGPKLNGNAGSGWAIFRIELGEISQLGQGSCHLGIQSEVFDAELYAIAEGLEDLNQIEIALTKIYICVDN
jgi:hypothetical protein